MKSGTTKGVRAKSETWTMTFWSGDGMEPDAVTVEMERDGHNFPATLTAPEAGAMIDALLELLPDAAKHAKLMRPSLRDFTADQLRVELGKRREMKGVGVELSQWRVWAEEHLHALGQEGELTDKEMRAALDDEFMDLDTAERRKRLKAGSHG